MLPSRWSPAHHRVLQYLLLCVCRHREELARTAIGQPGQRVVRIGNRPRQHLSQSGHRCSCQRAQRGERGGHPYVRPVQQPGHRQRGGRVHRRHRCPGVMPGVPVPGGGGRVSGVHRVPRHHHRGVAVRAGQREMQRALHGQRDHDRRDRPVTAPGERPDRSELRHDQHARQPPGHRAFGDRVMPESREHGAEHGEQAGPRTRSRVAGPAGTGTSLVPGHVIRRHGHPLFAPCELRWMSARQVPMARCPPGLLAGGADASRSGPSRARPGPGGRAEDGLGGVLLPHALAVHRPPRPPVHDGVALATTPLCRLAYAARFHRSAACYRT